VERDRFRGSSTTAGRALPVGGPGLAFDGLRDAVAAKGIVTVTCGLCVFIAVSAAGASFAQDFGPAAGQQPTRSTTEQTAAKEETGATETIKGLDECFAMATIANAICSNSANKASARLECLENARTAQQQCLDKVWANTELNGARTTVEPTLPAPEPDADLARSEGGQPAAAGDPGHTAEADRTASVLRTPDLPFALTLPQRHGTSAVWRDPPLNGALAWPDPPQQAPAPHMATSSRDAAPDTQPAAPATERHFDPQQAAALFRRAEAMIANRDLPAARLILQRLAEGKDAHAAYLLARTYDPVVLQELGVVGIKPEAEKAKSWYSQALIWGFPIRAEAPASAAEGKSEPGQAAALFQRAEAMIANGDLPAARLILQRLADSKDARAAYLLARTYDPVVLNELGVMGIKPEPEKARSWYDQARNWGFAQQPYEQVHALSSAPPATTGER
jgi:hypothetical protein